MNKNINSFIKIFWQLLKLDFIEYRFNIVDKIINFSIWTISTVAILNYITGKQFETNQNLGLFILTGCIASAGLFEVFPRVVQLVSDFEGDKTIEYQLTLPIPSELIFIKTIFYYGINSLSLTIPSLFLGKILIKNEFILSNVHWLKFTAIIIMASFFYGSFILWTTCKIKNTRKLQNVWMRFVFPIWFLGGYQFSWMTLNKVVGKLAYISLFNPIIYIMEGVRASIIGQENYIDFRICLSVITIFTLFFIVSSIRKLKKRLDCI